jgi:hypothetical protein
VWLAEMWKGGGNTRCDIIEIIFSVFLEIDVML